MENNQKASFKAAVEAGDAAEVRRLILEDPELQQVIDEPWFAFDAPALVYAAGLKNRELIDALIDAGADVDARSAWGAGPYSALHRMVDGASPESLALAEHLLARGATLDLHTAAGLGRTETVVAMLDAAPDRVNEPGPDGATPLHLARDIETAALLLSRGAEIDKRCVDHSSTPAQWALGDRPDVSRYLVDQGARRDLFMAAVFDDVRMAEEILAEDPGAIAVRVSGGRSNEHLGYGDKYTWGLGFADTPLEVARRKGNDTIYRWLLERSTPGVNLLHAARRGDVDGIARLIEEHPALLSHLDGDKGCGALRGELNAARALLDAGIDPNARDTEHQATATHFAAWDSDRERIALLLEYGADLSIRDTRYGGTPLGWAAANGHDELVDFLARQQPIDITDAAWLGDVDRVREILDADPGAAAGPNENAGAPLRVAAWYGHVEIVRLLLERGADPNVPNEETGKTARQHAAERGHTEVAKLFGA